MSDPGLVSGFMGVGIHIVIQQILQDINIANRCKKEMACMKNLVMTVNPIVMQIQQYRLAFNRNRDKASDVNRWLKKLDALIRQASKMVRWCTIPRSGVISSYKKSMMIKCLISDITEHLKSSPLLAPPMRELIAAGHSQKVLEGLGHTKESLEALSSSAMTSQAAIAPRGTARLNLIDEPLIVGQGEAIESLEKLVLDDADAKNIGVVGKSGSGKTLLMKTLFNTQKVRNHFSDGLLLWLNVSQCHSVPIVSNKLCTQIVMQTKVEVDRNMKDEDIEIWLKERVGGKRIALFLDNVREGTADESHGILRRLVIDHSNCKVIINSRDHTALLKMGVSERYMITIEDLREDESWMLFSYHAFPYNNRDWPKTIEEEKAKLVCDKCGGNPLATKVVGRAMAGSTHPQQWEWAFHRLANACSLDDCLRLSFDALGNEEVNLQLCFQVASAFLQDEIIYTEEVIPFWLGEGLLARKALQNEPARGGYNPLKIERVVDILEDRCLVEPMIRNIDGRLVCLRMQDPFDIGSLYVNLLAERCLIEPAIKDIDGRVVCFRIHSVLRDLAIQIAEEVENFYCRVGWGLTTLTENERSQRNRILLSHNELTDLSGLQSSGDIRSLLISHNPQLTKIGKEMMGSMITLTVLDLSETAIKVLPESVGCLKQLVCLRLLGVPINGLPESVKNLVYLEILDVSFSSIRELPSGLHMLRSLRFLGLRGCQKLQYLPYNIVGLVSLQYLHMDGCSNVWTKPKGNGYRKVASLQNLCILIQLKRLALQNNGEIVNEGTLGSMIQMDTLHLIFTEIKSLPLDMQNMSKLRRLSLRCFHLVKMETNLSSFRNLNYLKFYECLMLEELPQLHKLPSLRQLEIILCPRLKRFPIEFGEKEAFPSLKIFSLIGLHELEELSTLEKDSLCSLLIFTIMDCPTLKILPKDYLDLKTLQILRVYSCPIIARNLQRMDGENLLIDVMTMFVDTNEVIKRYLQVHKKKEDWLYGEFWCNELFYFMKSFMRTLM